MRKRSVCSSISIENLKIQLLFYRGSTSFARLLMRSGFSSVENERRTRVFIVVVVVDDGESSWFLRRVE